MSITRVSIRPVAVATDDAMIVTVAAPPANADPGQSPQRALATVQPMAPLTRVAIDGDDDSAAVRRTDHASVDVARDETGYTSLAIAGSTPRIGLPNPRTGNRAHRGAGNRVAYPGTRQLTNVVRITPTGPGAGLVGLARPG